MKLFFLVITFSFLKEFPKQTKSKDKYYTYNSCAIAKHNKSVNVITNVSIVKYAIVNNLNKKKNALCEYFLISSSQGTFNVVMIVNGEISDTVVKEYRWNQNWIFEKMKDTCVNFKSDIKLSNEINNKYPVLFGKVFLLNE